MSRFGGIGYHSDIVPLETIMTVVARQFALMAIATKTVFKHRGGDARFRYQLVEAVAHIAPAA